jgi:hypothetical protein
MLPCVELGARWLVALAIGIGASASSFGMIVQISLDQMVAESTLIVLGQVESVVRICGPCPEPNQLTLFRATVRVEEALKGVGQRNVPVYFSQGESSPTLSIGQRSILLLQPWQDGYVTGQGYGGKLDVVDAVVPRIYAVGEAQNQPIEPVIARIRQAAQQ